MKRFIEGAIAINAHITTAALLATNAAAILSTAALLLAAPIVPDDVERPIARASRSAVVAALASWQWAATTIAVVLTYREAEND